MPEDLKSKLDAHYNEVIARLRVKAPEETAELLQVIAAREGIRAFDGSPPASQSLPYVYYDSVIDAILDWFKDRNNQPADVDDVVQGVLKGGLQLQSPRRELNVRDSIRFQTKNKAHGKLKFVGKMIQPKVT